jgi:hypothetical protein
VTTTTPTTISGVSLISPLITRPSVFEPEVSEPEVFEIVLSAGGIDFRRTQRPCARVTWESVSEWEVEEREGDVLLTLQGADAATPLLIPGWSATDLSTLLRQLTEQPTQAKAAATPVRAKNPVRAKEHVPASAEEKLATRATSRPARRLVRWKAVVAFALLGLLAAAVAIVLLQSAGVIHWSFLGPNI